MWVLSLIYVTNVSFTLKPAIETTKYTFVLGRNVLPTVIRLVLCFHIRDFNLFDRGDHSRLDVRNGKLRQGPRIYDRREHSLVVEIVVENHNTVNINGKNENDNLSGTNECNSFC